VAGVGHLGLALAFSSSSSGPSDGTVWRSLGVACSALPGVVGLRRCGARWVLVRLGQRGDGEALGWGWVGPGVVGWLKGPGGCGGLLG